MLPLLLFVCVCMSTGAKVHVEQSLVRVIQSDGSTSEHNCPPAEKATGLPAAVEALVDKAKLVRGRDGVLGWTSRLNWCI